MTPLRPESDKSTIACDYEDTWSPSTNAYRFTCTVRNLPSDPSKTTFEPDQRNRRVKKLLIDDDNLEKLPANIGSNFPDLEEFVVKNSKLKILTSEDLKNMPNLKELDLSHNLLTAVSIGLFQNNPAIEKINLENNKIHSANTRAFDGLRKLISVNLKHNGCVDELFEYQTISQIGRNLKENCGVCMKIEKELAACRQQRTTVKSPMVVESLKNENEKLRSLLKVSFGNYFKFFVVFFY